MNKLELEKIMKGNPSLTKHGFSDELDYSIGDYKGIDTITNPLTCDLLEEVNFCEAWLRKQKFTKTFVTRGRPTTYGLKHLVERESGKYIPAGCMIAAVFHLGIDFKRRPFTPDVWIPISRKIV